MHWSKWIVNFRWSICTGLNSAIFHLRIFGWGGIWTQVSQLRSRRSIHYSTSSRSAQDLFTFVPLKIKFLFQLQWKWLHPHWCWFHQCFLSSFEAHRSQKLKKTLMSWLLLGSATRKALREDNAGNCMLIANLLNGKIFLMLTISWKYEWFTKEKMSKKLPVYLLYTLFIGRGWENHKREHSIHGNIVNSNIVICSKMQTLRQSRFGCWEL